MDGMVVERLDANPRLAASASCARSRNNLKNAELTDEESHVREEVEHVHGNPVGFRGTDDGAYREFAAEEWAGLRHDEVGLELLAAKGRRVQVGEGYRNMGDGMGCGEGRSVAGLVGPGLKVHGFGGADADEDAEDFDAGPRCAMAG